MTLPQIDKIMGRDNHKNDHPLYKDLIAGLDPTMGYTLDLAENAPIKAQYKHRAVQDASSAVSAFILSDLISKGTMTGVSAVGSRIPFLRNHAKLGPVLKDMSKNTSLNPLDTKLTAENITAKALAIPDAVIDTYSTDKQYQAGVTKKRQVRDARLASEIVDEIVKEAGVDLLTKFEGGSPGLNRIRDIIGMQGKAKETIPSVEFLRGQVALDNRIQKIRDNRFVRVNEAGAVNLNARDLAKFNGPDALLDYAAAHRNEYPIKATGKVPKEDYSYILDARAKKFRAREEVMEEQRLKEEVNGVSPLMKLLGGS